MQERVAALATGLKRMYGLQPGQIVPVAVQSSDYFMEALLAVIVAGGVAAPINLRWSSPDSQRAVASCDSKLIIADRAGNDLLPSAAGPILLTGEHCSLQGARSTELLIAQEKGALYSPVSAPLGAAVVCFTSGSTGTPKGTLLSHTAFHVQAVAKILFAGYSNTDIYLHCAPLFHIGGLSSALAMLMVGAQHIFLPRYSAAATCSLLECQQASTC